VTRPVSASALAGTTADRLRHFAGVDWSRALAWLRTLYRASMAVAPEQEVTVQPALRAKADVLSGGPCRGKSFSARPIAELAAAKIMLVTPIGRAAKRLAELAGQPIATVHRCSSCIPAATPVTAGPIHWTGTYWWSTRRPCST